MFELFGGWKGEPPDLCSDQLNSLTPVPLTFDNSDTDCSSLSRAINVGCIKKTVSSCLVGRCRYVIYRASMIWTSKIHCRIFRVL